MNNPFITVLPKKFKLDLFPPAYDWMSNFPTLDVQDAEFKSQLEALKTGAWIHSSKRDNRSSLFYTYRLDRECALFCEDVIRQLQPFIPGTPEPWRVGMIRTPVCGIDWYIDDGNFRNCGINIGARNTESCMLNFRKQGLDGSESLTIQLRDGDVALLNLNEQHCVNNVSGHSKERVLITYSFVEKYDEILNHVLLQY